MTESYQLETLAVRAGTERSQFHEHSEAMFLTSSFVFDTAEQAAKRFIGEEPGNIYARFTNPTVTMFEQRLAALEGAEQCVATASGMSARGRRGGATIVRLTALIRCRKRRPPRRRTPRRARGPPRAA